MTKSTTSVRRKPLQARSRERVEHILDAAEKLLEKEGFEALNTNAIAACAGISIGSLYHFFPGKLAVLEALIARYDEGYFGVLEAVHTEAARTSPLEDYVGHLFTALERYEHAHPSLMTAFKNAMAVLPAFEVTNRAFNQRVARLLATFYRARKPELDQAQAIRIGHMVIAVAESLPFVYSGANGHGLEDQDLVEEAGRLLLAYLSLYL